MNLRAHALPSVPPNRARIGRAGRPQTGLPSVASNYTPSPRGSAGLAERAGWADEDEAKGLAEKWHAQNSEAA